MAGLRTVSESRYGLCLRCRTRVAATFQNCGNYADCRELWIGLGCAAWSCTATVRNGAEQCSSTIVVECGGLETSYPQKLRTHCSCDRTSRLIFPHSRTGIESL